MPRFKSSHGFSLLEIVLVLFVLGMLAATLAPSVRAIIGRAQSEAEKRTLDELATTIVASFDETDLTKLNVAALPGTIGTVDEPTGFSTFTTGTYATTQSGDWFAKVARLRGLLPQIGVAPAAQPELAKIAHNAMGQARFLFSGPTEPGRQRFLLVSLVAPPGQLILPAFEPTAGWFEALWQQDWESRTAAPPMVWATKLTPAQFAAWGADGGGLTQVQRLCVRRIVIPKFTLTVNNNHPTDSAYLAYNNQGLVFTASPASGANTTPEILAGRLITVSRGSAPLGLEVLRFRLRENATVTVQ